MSWERYDERTERVAISPEKWGRDHWSTLLYVEDRSVSYGNFLNYSHMRCDPRVHGGLEYIDVDESEFPHPTKLRDGEIVDFHDDYSCLEDMQVAGLLNLEYDVENGKYTLVEADSGKYYSARVYLSDKGWNWAHKVRRHMGNFGTLSSFSYKYIIGLDEETLQSVADAIEYTEFGIDVVAEKYGYSNVVELRDLEAALRDEAELIQCADCSTWYQYADTYDDLCEDCVRDEYDEEDCYDYDYDDRDSFGC